MKASEIEEEQGAAYAGGGCVSHRWLGIASFGVPEKLGCANLPLSSRQKELCKRKPYLLPSIREGARLGIQECRSQFRHERWNCRVAAPAAAPLDQGPLFGYELSSGESSDLLGPRGWKANKPPPKKVAPGRPPAETPKEAFASGGNPGALGQTLGRRCGLEAGWREMAPQVWNRTEGDCGSSSFPRRLAPTTPSNPGAPPYVSDQLEKHEAGREECCSRICFDLAGSAAH